MSPTIVFRKMNIEDISDGVQLCRYASWNQVEQDWQFILNIDPEGSIVAVDTDKVVGAVSTIKYGNDFSWIGMVLVDPQYQKQGIGHTLLKLTLDILQKETTIKLDATPQGREIYLKLNFRDEYPLTRMVCEIVRELPEEKRVSVITAKEFEKINNYDKKIFGANRKVLLGGMFEKYPQYAFYYEDNGKIKGYCLGRNGHLYTQLGPIVADELSIGKKLLLTVLKKIQGKVVVDIFQHSAEWTDWLGSLGFKKERSFVRMYHGQNNFGGILNNQFAITGPEFG
ncbi:MAG: GNAT family N-acetyltransferase [Flavitalea sp.]